MNLMKKWKTNKKINEALKKADDPVWYVTYRIGNDLDGTLQVYASSEGSAMNKATEKLSEISNGRVWCITSISCI